MHTCTNSVIRNCKKYIKLTFGFLNFPRQMEQLRGCLLISAVAPGSGSDTGPEDDDDVSLATKQLLFVEEIMFTLGLKLHNDP